MGRGLSSHVEQQPALLWLLSGHWDQDEYDCPTFQEITLQSEGETGLGKKEDYLLISDS